MGCRAKIGKETKRQKIRFSSYFRSEVNFREETVTVDRETPFLRLLAFLSQLSQALAYLSGIGDLIKLFGFNRKKFLRPRHSTSFPGSLILPPSTAPEGGKMRDPGNEVARHSLDRLINAGKVSPSPSPWFLHVWSPHMKSQRKYKENVCFTAVLPCKFALITHSAP